MRVAVILTGVVKVERQLFGDRLGYSDAGPVAREFFCPGIIKHLIRDKPFCIWNDRFRDVFVDSHHCSIAPGFASGPKPPLNGAAVREAKPFGWEPVSDRQAQPVLDPVETGGIPGVYIPIEWRDRQCLGRFPDKADRESAIGQPRNILAKAQGQFVKIIDLSAHRYRYLKIVPRLNILVILSSGSLRI